MYLASRRYHNEPPAAALDELDDGVIFPSVWCVVLLCEVPGWKNPDRAMLSVMRTRYSDESLAEFFLVAAKVAPSPSLFSQLWSEFWLIQGKTVEDAFQLLNLHKAVKNILEKPDLEAWVSYATKLAKVDKKSPEFAVISVLDERFGDFELAMMLSAAKIKSATNSGGNARVISDLQTLQFKKWLKSGVTPGEISDKSTRNFDTRGLGVVLGYHDFYKANHARSGA